MRNRKIQVKLTQMLCLFKRMNLSPRHFWLVGMGLILAATAPTTAIAQSRPNLESLSSDRGAPYPEFVQQQWMSICQGDAGTEMQPFCACMLDELQVNYSLREFIQLGLELDAGGATPQKLEQLSNACAAGTSATP
jgi:hypothetical protein